MSQKRKHAETADSSSSAPKPFKKHRPFKPGKGQQKQRRPQVSDDIDKGPSIHSLKSRIRDLKRLLAHVNNVGDHKMSAGNKVERERELEACEHELQEKIESSREAAYRQKMISKYHQVRFFDRQKATRIHKRLEKELAAEEDRPKRKELQLRVHNAEVDVNYAIYYPLMKPYSSLYPKSKKEKTESDEGEGEDKTNREIDGPKGDVEMWRAVEEAMEDRTQGALKALRYSKDDLPAPAPQKEKKKQQTTNQHVKNKEDMKMQAKLAEAKNRRERRAIGAHAQEEAEDSDGGFFE